MSALKSSKLDDYEGNSSPSKPDDGKFNGFIDMVVSPGLKSKSSDYSGDSEAKAATFRGSENQAKTTIEASILQDEKEEKDSYKAGSYTVCKPSALKKYLKATNQNSLNRHGPFERHSEHCDFQIMDAQKKNASEQRSILEWGALNGKLHKVLKSMKKYPKGSHPPTFDPAFVADAAKLANDFLVTSNTDHCYVDFSRRLTICKENKDVNEILLNYATSIAIFKRTDMPNFVPNPTQTPKALAIFPRSSFHNLPNSKGDDYALLLGDKSFNLHNETESHTNDRIEAQLDYWREDPFLHAFHCILHQAWSQLFLSDLKLSGRHRKKLKEINS